MRPRLTVKKPGSARPTGTSRVPRFILRHAGSPIPAAALQAVKAIDELTVVHEAFNSLLVQGPSSVEAVHRLLDPEDGWVVSAEQFYRPASK